jgi:hypothetical protein
MVTNFDREGSLSIILELGNKGTMMKKQALKAWK